MAIIIIITPRLDHKCRQNWWQTFVGEAFLAVLRAANFSSYSPTFPSHVPLQSSPLLLLLLPTLFPTWHSPCNPCIHPFPHSSPITLTNSDLKLPPTLSQSVLRYSVPHKHFPPHFTELCNYSFSPLKKFMNFFWSKIERKKTEEQEVRRAVNDICVIPW